MFRQIPLILLSSLIAFILSVGCTDDGGGGGDRKDSEGDAKPTTPTDDCFGLQDDDPFAVDDEGEAAEGEGEGDDPLAGDDPVAGDDPLTTDEDPAAGEAEDTANDNLAGGSNDCEKPFTPTEPTEPTDPGPGTGGGGSTDGPSYEECVSQGKAWVPVSNSGSYCGDALVSWCCTESVVLARFKRHVDERTLGTDISDLTGQGYKLYHCSKSADEKVYFHFAVKESGTTKYKNIWVKGGEVEAEDPAECPVVTPADMGFGADDGDDDGEEDDGEEDDGEEDDGEEDDGEEDDGEEDDGEEDDGETDIEISDGDNEI